MKLRALIGKVFGPGKFDELRLVQPLFASPGVMLDVGAHFGGTTAPFAGAGWEVHAFEPDSNNRAKLEIVTSSFPKVTVIPAAVSHERGTMTLFRSSVSSGISSLSAFHETHQGVEKVEVITIDDYVRSARIGHVDLLKIDAEGHDLHVLMGFPWDRMRPRVIVCEFEDRKTSLLNYNYHDLARFLRDKDYAVIVSEWYPIERYGVQHRWRRIQPYPCELMDENAWGNLIAIPPPLVRRLLARGRLMSWRLRARRSLQELRGK